MPERENHDPAPTPATADPIEEFLAIARRSVSRSPPEGWTREDLYERRGPRDEPPPDR
jgi:hypothetical protein